MEAASGIHGYTYGSPELERSPVSAEDLDLLEQTVLFGEEDARHLRRRARSCATRWRTCSTSGTASSLRTRTSSTTSPAPTASRTAITSPASAGALASGSATCASVPGIRIGSTTSTRSRAVTPARRRTGPTAPSRRPDPAAVHGRLHLSDHGHGARLPGQGGRPTAEVDAMHQAWFKAVTLSVALWSQPYADADW